MSDSIFTAVVGVLIARVRRAARIALLSTYVVNESLPVLTRGRRFDNNSSSSLRSNSTNIPVVDML